MSQLDQVLNDYFLSPAYADHRDKDGNKDAIPLTSQQRWDMARVASEVINSNRDLVNSNPEELSRVITKRLLADDATKQILHDYAMTKPGSGFVTWDYIDGEITKQLQPAIKGMIDDNREKLNTVLEAERVPATPPVFEVGSSNGAALKKAFDEGNPKALAAVDRYIDYPAHGDIEESDERIQLRALKAEIKRKLELTEPAPMELDTQGKIRNELRKAVINAYKDYYSQWHYDANDDGNPLSEYLKEETQKLKQANDKIAGKDGIIGLKGKDPHQFAQGMPKKKDNEPVAFIDPKSPSIPSGGGSRQL